ncbi:MAG: isoleucine--tRNA ligase [Bacteroidetes bacterium]|nr:isoleucine--tRNA ligase [Bacteroidota bacterium]
MAKHYPEYQKLSLPELDKDILRFWKENDIFNKSISTREGGPAFVFYEGPPSANGHPGIHHVMGRTIKDIFCRYKTLKGFQVHRKAGWDTHGLPIELNVEKELGITKDDIGVKISVEDYNKACKESVMRFTNEWNEVTENMGYWVDMEHPYVTYESNYIESCWWLLRQLFDKGFLYKGYTIQPYSPAAGTGLSSHELNQPGTYQTVKDTTIVAQFKVVRDAKSETLFQNAAGDLFFLAWTTTPWTLPSNTALAVGKTINYVQVNTSNPYTDAPISVILAEPLLGKVLGLEGALVDGRGTGKVGGKKINVEVVGGYAGADLAGIHYEQLMPYVQPEGDAFRVIVGDFVTTEDGTGIVHIAPTFGADDFRVAAQNGVPALLITYPDGSKGPLVDKKGRFVPQMGPYAGMYVKNYTGADESAADYKSTDVLIAIQLKEENKAFKVEKYEHEYPHCWRTDKPILYYPLDAWFIKTTAVKDRMVELNKTINWKPESTGTGRFGNWLENLVDWNLSRSRFWGIPLPIWATDDYAEKKCIGSREELVAEMQKAVAAGFMTQDQATEFSLRDDLHRPYVDYVVLVSDSGKPMRREPDLIDVWFDSGSMPAAQLHYPFENKALFEQNFPADFIAEGVDQTRGWFFTLHAIATMVFDKVAYKNVVSNGLVLDKNGVKMSKRLGNVVDPFKVLPEFGADTVRWYMVGNAAPWDNLKFNEAHMKESQQSYFGTLFNTYFFFAQYANVDQFDFSQPRIPVSERRELDRWVMSKLNTLIAEVDNALGEYEPHRGVKAMEAFLDELSNWYIRLSRRVFWKGEMSDEKVAAYQTLYECLLALSKLMASYAPFYSEKLFGDLNKTTGLEAFESVHLAEFPVSNPAEIDLDLEQRMNFAREITSLVHSIRKNPQVNVKVRQPLARVLVPVLDEAMAQQVLAVQDIILSEINVKAIELVRDGDGNTVIVKKAKANFKALGARLGQKMKFAAEAIEKFGNKEFAELTKNGKLTIQVDGAPFELLRDDVEIRTADVPGWRVASNENVTVALDLTLSDALKREGLAREIVSRIQGIRKDSGLEVTDRISVLLSDVPEWREALTENNYYICNETLADSLKIESGLVEGTAVEVDGVQGWIKIAR